MEIHKTRRKKITALALDGEKIVGCLHSQPSILTINNKKIFSVLGADLVIHKNYRGHGLYGELRELSYSLREKKGIQVHYAINENPILIEKRKRDEHEKPDKYPNFPARAFL